MSAAGVALALLAGRHRPAKPRLVHLSAAGRISYPHHSDRGSGTTLNA
jgi:hypothetical protein